MDSSVAAPDSGKTNQVAANDKQSVFVAATNMIGLRSSFYAQSKTAIDGDHRRA